MSRRRCGWCSVPSYICEGAAQCPPPAEYSPSFAEAKPETWLDLCQNCGHVRHRHYCDTGICLEKHDYPDRCVCGRFVPLPSKEPPGPRYDLFETGPMRRHAERLGLGAVKYGDNDWKKTQTVRDQINHVRDHLAIIMAGGAANDDWAAIACRAHFAMWLEDNKG